MSSYCRDVTGEVALLTGHIRRGRLICRYVFGEVMLVPERVRSGRHCFGTFTARSAYCRDMSVDVGFVSGNVRQYRLIVGT